MVALCTIVAYSDRCERISDTADLTFRTLYHAYSDVGQWERWDEPRMSKIRDRIRSLFETRETNPVTITGKNSCDQTLLSLIPPELRVVRVQRYATCGRRDCAKKTGGDGLQSNPIFVKWIGSIFRWIGSTTPTFSVWLTNWYLIL